MEHLDAWGTWERLALVVETEALVTGGVTWWLSRLFLKRQYTLLTKQYTSLKKHNDQQREAMDCLVRIVCEPDPEIRKQHAIYFHHVVSEPDEKKRQECFDSIAINLSAHLRTEDGLAAHLTVSPAASD